jgi:TonB-linked SusC/RagA family outer membrane protein
MFLLVVLATSIGFAQGQTRQISGRVLDDANDEPIAGATIVQKGTSNATMTDVDGRFTLSVPQSGATLVISNIGHLTQEVAATNGITVRLRSDEQFLDEVVVTAYGTSTKGTFTGSASEIKADKIGKLQVSNVTQALLGAVSGVQVLNNNGQPGESATIRIRGVGSINAGTDPLYLVDGIPFDGDMSSINTHDIESVTVLKDAASMSLYGARGANGIVAITTKGGKIGKGIGKANITLDVRQGFNSRAVKNYDVMTSPQNYLEKEYEAIYNAGFYNLEYSPLQANAYANSVITTQSGGGSGYTIYTVPAGELLIGTNGKLNPNATLGYSDGKYYYTPDNWAKEMFKSKMRSEYNLSISGVTEKLLYYSSFGYLNDEGVIDGSGFSRFSGRLKADYNAKNWLKVGTNINYNNMKSRYPGEQTTTNSSVNAFYIANYIAPIYPIYVRDGITHQINTISGNKVYDYGEGNGDGSGDAFQRRFMPIANPLGDLILNKTEYLMDILNSNVYAEIKPVKGLTLTARYGINLDNTRYNDYGNMYQGQSAEYGGTAYQEYERTLGFDQQYFANYIFSINDANHFDFMAGYDGYSWDYAHIYAYGVNLYRPDSYYVGNAIENLIGKGYRDTYATEGYFARLNYSYNDNYIANIAFRRDASSRFAPENRWGNFYAASAAWVISNENFIKNLNWVNLLKLKASFGQQGNDDILDGRGYRNYYPYIDQWQITGSDGKFSDQKYVFIGNRDISWEKQTTYNAGLEFVLFKQKLSGSIEYFGRKSKDLLYYFQLWGSTGKNYKPMNVGSITNSGLEIELNYIPVKNSNLEWSLFANTTFIKNRINSLAPELKGKWIDTNASRILEVGKSMYHMYLVEWAGVDHETGEALYYAQDAYGNRITTADYSVAEDYKVSSAEMYPLAYGGFGTSVRFYGFDASIQCAYQLGGKIYDNGYARLMHGGTASFAGTNWHKDIYNSWTPDNPNTDVPRVNASDRYANSMSTRFITSSNYLSLNNITLGYSIPTEWMKGLEINSIRIYLVGDNLALLSARKGLDPRQGFYTATTARYTPIRSISGGVTISF